MNKQTWVIALTCVKWLIFAEVHFYRDVGSIHKWQVFDKYTRRGNAA